MAQAQFIAKVSVLSGQAYAKDSAGNMRRLKVGDAIREGESVVAGQGANVVLALVDGREMSVRPGETARIDAEVAAAVPPDAADSGIANNKQGFQAITQALKSGSNLDDLLEDTAAGAGPQGGNEGHTFVELLRIVETVDPLAFQFGTNRGAPLDTIEGAPLVSVAAAAAIPGTPTVSIPDANNPGAGDGDKTVAETSGPVPGTFTITAPAGLGSLSIGGQTFTTAQLADPVYLAAHPVNTGEGLLTLQGYDPLTGVVSYTYDPSVQNHNGPVIDNIPVVVTDVLGRSVPDSLDITITDSVPVAVNDSISIAEDAASNIVSGNVLLGAGADTVGADVNPNPVTAVTVALAHGNLVLNSDGTYTYTLNNADPAVNALRAGQTLTDSYTYTLTDGDGSTTTAVLTITIDGSNDAPVDGDETNTVTEDTTLTVAAAGGLLANTVDPDGGTPSVTGYTIAGMPGTQAVDVPVTIAGVGTITINADGGYSFVPDANYAGAIPVITYTVSDGNGGTDISTLTLSMTPVNDPPVATPSTAAGDEDTPIAVVLSGTDIDGTVQGVTVTGLPPVTQGTLYLPDGVTPVVAGTPLTPTDAANLIFKPAPDFNGSVNIPFTVTDNSGAVSTPAQATITVNPVVDPVISINDVIVNEAAGIMTFTVTLDQATTATVNVNFATTPGTAVSPADFAAASGMLTFAPGVTTQTVTVNIANDNLYEGSETLNVVLSTPVNATIGDGLGIGTIKDDGTGPGGSDDDRPTLSVSDVTVNEGDGHAQFVVTLSNPSTQATTVALALNNGTATLGSDYTNALEVSTDGGATWTAATSATFAPNATSLLVRTPLVEDLTNEPNEAFTLTATTTAGVTANPNATGTATIIDNDGPPQVTINDMTVNEGAGTITFTVSLSNPSAGTVTVNYATAGDTAVSPADYAAGTNGLNGTLT
ncbi:retention module-containing protein, partial [uncultured Dechloromonas sp.]|uniref:retention module-containing protein n=1 Tax=uncultured Dechloromonas sp. TaxID=171719 RepID=UPI0025EC6AB4